MVIPIEISLQASTASKGWRSLTICGLLVAALGVLAPNVAYGAAPEELPAFEAPSDSHLAISTDSPAAIVSESIVEPIPAPLTDDLVLHCDAPAVTESSGTWLRRGLWYADLEAVVMARTWDSDGIVFAQEPQQVSVFAPPNQEHAFGESSPGADGSARLSLGRFLFRDYKNRDHNAEMVVMGGAEWDEEFQLTALTPGGLDVPLRFTLNNTAPSFNGSQSMDLIYSSRLTSFEWNYSVTERMRRDRMELQPTGQWIRKAAPGLTQEFLAGLRFIDLEENVDWIARDVTNNVVNDGDGSLFVRARNNSFGVQLGYGLSYETDRWNVSVNTKQGFLISDARAVRDFSLADETNTSAFVVSGHENRLNYLAQVAIISRYHLRPNLSLRFGWEFIYLTNLALAPNQISFNPSTSEISTTGDAIYHGLTFGTEYYW